MKRIAAVILTIMIVLSLTYCSAGEAEQQQDSLPAPAFGPLGEVIDGRKNIYLIVKNLDSSYWQVIVDGAGDSGNDLDCNVYSSGTYSETDWQGQEKLLEEAVAAGADAIVFAPNDSVKLSAKIDEIYNMGIHIVLIDTAANTDNYDICYMTDNLMAGQQAAAEMISRLKDSGASDSERVQVGIQVGATSSQTINERLAGFFQYWSKYAPDAWEVIPDVKCNDGYVDKAVECADELLGYPELRGVFGTNNGSTVGFAQAVKDHERKDVIVVGFDYSDEIAELINDEEYMASTILQNQYHMGYTGVETALRLIDGEDMSVKFEDTGVVVVNKDTIDLPEVREVLLHN